jgi:CheY-like chemotaxis protein
MSLKVLLVDDDKVALFLQRIIILESKFTSDVETFSNGMDTLAYLNTHYQDGQEFFIFLDIHMPGMNGWQLLEAINAQPYADQVFVAMASSYSALPDLAPAYGFRQLVYTFEKPVTIEGCQEIMALPALKKHFIITG